MPVEERDRMVEGEKGRLAREEVWLVGELEWIDIGRRSPSAWRR